MNVARLDSFRAINDEAIANVDRWIHALGLPRLKRAGHGYSAVAGFRPSRRAGLAEAKRPRALTIGPRGIKDHAEGRGYSPIDLVAVCLGIDPCAAKDWLADALGGSIVAAEPPMPAIATGELVRNSLAKAGALERRWAQCIPIAGTPAEAYLASRSLGYDGDALRYSPRERAMAALVTDPTTGDPQTIQFTFLDEEARKRARLFIKGHPSVGVVRLSADESVTAGLAIAEGIETALAAPFRPIWACLVANNLSVFPVLPGIEALTIFADNDASGTGERAAMACAERWHASGREVTVRMVDQVGVDYADLVEAA